MRATRPLAAAAALAAAGALAIPAAAKPAACSVSARAAFREGNRAAGDGKTTCNDGIRVQLSEWERDRNAWVPKADIDTLYGYAARVSTPCKYWGLNQDARAWRVQTWSDGLYAHHDDTIRCVA